MPSLRAFCLTRCVPVGACALQVRGRGLLQERSGCRRLQAAGAGASPPAHGGSPGPVARHLFLPSGWQAKHRTDLCAEKMASRKRLALLSACLANGSSSTHVPSKPPTAGADLQQRPAVPAAGHQRHGRRGRSHAGHGARAVHAWYYTLACDWPVESPTQRMLPVTHFCGAATAAVASTSHPAHTTCLVNRRRWWAAAAPPPIVLPSQLLQISPLPILSLGYTCPTNRRRWRAAAASPPSTCPPTALLLACAHFVPLLHPNSDICRRWQAAAASPPSTCPPTTLATRAQRRWLRCSRRAGLPFTMFACECGFAHAAVDEACGPRQR